MNILDVESPHRGFIAVRQCTARALWAGAVLVVFGITFLAVAAPAAASPFATRVVEYRPAPGQFVNNPQFNDPARSLGPPVGGGTVQADLSSLVSLGGFGGSITLAFDHPIPNRPATPANPRGLDLIIFGNAVYVGGNPNRRFAECGVVEVAVDANANGLADDAWYLLSGSHLAALVTQTPKTWDTDTNDPTYPPANPAWIPFWAPPPPTPETFETRAYPLPALFAVNVLVNPLGSSATTEGVWGYADHTPTLLLGDINADNVIDDANVQPSAFYTRPDDPLAVGVSSGSGGGDALDLSWAVDPSTGSSVTLSAIDFVRISTGVDGSISQINELSTEIDAVAEALATPLADYDGDGVAGVVDLFQYLDLWFALNGSNGLYIIGDHDSDGSVTVVDLFAYLSDWFAGT